jgi:hypothetical protein
MGKFRIANAFDKGREVSYVWHYARVVSNVDPENAGRIRVKIYGDPIYGLDGDYDRNPELELKDPNDGGLPWCEPLLPKFINILPKEGEMVRITTFELTNKKKKRLYIGPVIGQQIPPDLLNSEYNDAITSVDYEDYWNSWELNPKASFPPKTGDWKIYPKKDDISLIGRINTDVILRDNGGYNSVILRAGKIKSDTLNSSPEAGNSPYELNLKNPAYITVSFLTSKNFTNPSGGDFKKLNLLEDKSYINLVADNINLMSHQGSQSGDKAKIPAIISGENIGEQEDVENTLLHPIPYGDKLWEFLNILRVYVENHTHEGSRLPSDKNEEQGTLPLLDWFNKNMGGNALTTKKDSKGNSYSTVPDGCTFLSKGIKTN